MNNTTEKVSHEFQQDVATMKIFHLEQFTLYGNSHTMGFPMLCIF